MNAEPIALKSNGANKHETVIFSQSLLFINLRTHVLHGKSQRDISCLISYMILNYQPH